MRRKNEEITALLLEHYPEGQCALVYKDPFELLVASRLSAQCTDKRVNIVTKDLFARFPDVASMAAASVEEIENLIKSCGLYHTKARDIKAMCEMLLDTYGGIVPDNMDDLLSLPGVGRKIANLMLGEIYHQQGVIVADTHCIRLSNRLGYCQSDNQVVVERELRKDIPSDVSLLFCHALVNHGRTVCTAQSPKCKNCFLQEKCKFYKHKGARKNEKD